MNLVPQKTQYALRAVFELARHFGNRPTKIAEIARTQAIPIRFLEVILNQLKQGGFVASQRGSDGGYYLVSNPAELTVGDVMRFLQGPLFTVSCMNGSARERCALAGNCVFLPMWEKVAQAVSEVYDSTTLQSLVDQAKDKAATYVPGYAI
ncbi:Rrf2 family transcriptional regulator [Candidatus Sumerlaeota bacterium]|nr:Rrf2 family transcriptional regulator [Candidatus Sumerlaeota bacterium]